MLGVVVSLAPYIAVVVLVAVVDVVIGVVVVVSIGAGVVEVEAFLEIGRARGGVPNVLIVVY